MFRRSLGFALLSVACSSSDDSTLVSSSGTTPPNDGSVVGDVRESITGRSGRSSVASSASWRSDCHDRAGREDLVQRGDADPSRRHLKVSAKDKSPRASRARSGRASPSRRTASSTSTASTSRTRTSATRRRKTPASASKNSKILTIRPVEVGVKSKLTLDHVEASVPAVVQGIAEELRRGLWRFRGALPGSTRRRRTKASWSTRTRGDHPPTRAPTRHGGQDLIHYGAKSLKRQLHRRWRARTAAPHLQEADSAVIDRVTSTANLFGITIYGAKVATVTNEPERLARAARPPRRSLARSVRQQTSSPTAANTPPNAIQEQNTDPSRRTAARRRRSDGAPPRLLIEGRLQENWLDLAPSAWQARCPEASLAAEFPNDNPALHAGVELVCLSPLARPTAELSVHEPPPRPAVVPEPIIRRAGHGGGEGASFAGEPITVAAIVEQGPATPSRPEVMAAIPEDSIIVEDPSRWSEVHVEGVVPGLESIAPPTLSPKRPTRASCRRRPTIRSPPSMHTLA